MISILLLRRMIPFVHTPLVLYYVMSGLKRLELFLAHVLLLSLNRQISGRCRQIIHCQIYSLCPRMEKMTWVLQVT